MGLNSANSSVNYGTTKADLPNEEENTNGNDLGQRPSRSADLNNMWFGTIVDLKDF